MLVCCAFFLSIYWAVVSNSSYLSTNDIHISILSEWPFNGCQMGMSHWNSNKERKLIRAGLNKEDKLRQPMQNQNAAVISQHNNLANFLLQCHRCKPYFLWTASDTRPVWRKREGLRRGRSFAINLYLYFNGLIGILNHLLWKNFRQIGAVLQRITYFVNWAQI